MLLDEPINHLGIAARTRFEQADLPFGEFPELSADGLNEKVTPELGG